MAIECHPAFFLGSAFRYNVMTLFCYDDYLQMLRVPLHSG